MAQASLLLAGHVNGGDPASRKTFYNTATRSFQLIHALIPGLFKPSKTPSFSRSKERPPKPRRGEKAAKYRPHHPQPPYRRKKTCKNGNLYTVDLRVILWNAIDNGRLAVDDGKRYRPHRLPANSPFYYRRGRCGRYFVGFLLRPGPVRITLLETSRADRRSKPSQSC